MGFVRLQFPSAHQITSWQCRKDRCQTEGERVLKLSLSVAIWFHFQKSISSSVTTLNVLLLHLQFIRLPSPPFYSGEHFLLESNGNRVFLQQEEKVQQTNNRLYAWKWGVRGYISMCACVTAERAPICMKIAPRLMPSTVVHGKFQVLGGYNWVATYCVKVRHTLVDNGC